MNGALRILGVAAVTFFFANQAQAVPVATLQDLGQLSVPSTTSFSRSATFGVVEFTDTFKFTVESLVSATALAVTFSLGSLVDVSDFAIELFEGSTSLATATVSELGVITVSALSYANLEPLTQYSLVVTGEIDGGKLGFYAGQLQLQAVPIPPALLLFASALAGLLIVGRIRRRRIEV